jgi:drug/metabolite transporter (DMT)-like permease
LGALIAGVSGLMIKGMSIPATSIAWIRHAVPAIILVWWLTSRNVKLFSGSYKTMLVASVINAIRMYFFLTAYLYTTISNAVVISYTWPIFTTLMGAFFLKERLSLSRGALLMLSFGGILVIYSDGSLSFGDKDFIGMTASLISAVFYSVTVILFKSESLNYHRNHIIFFQNLVGAFVFLPFILLNRPVPTGLDWSIGLSYGLVIGIGLFSCFFYGLKYLKASTVSMISYLEIVSAIFFGVVFLGEVVTPQILVGGGLIVLSTALLRRVRTAE